MLELYLKETAAHAQQHGQILEQVRERLNRGERLSELELNGVLHSLQVLIENAIGMAKHLLKQRGLVVPTSATEAFQRLAQQGLMDPDALDEWRNIVGLRNRIVHDYLNLDTDQLLELVRQKRYQTLIDFLVSGHG